LEKAAVTVEIISQFPPPLALQKINPPPFFDQSLLLFICMISIDLINPVFVF